MKDDVPVPDEIPRKRKDLERALDRFLAVWLAREDLTPSERRRLQEERDRRRALQPDVKVALLVGNEGMTPPQRNRMMELVLAVEPTRILFPQAVTAHIRQVQSLAPEAEGFPDEREMLREATMAIAAPKEPEKPDVVSGVWDGVRFAKHRKIPVRVVMTDGSERT